MKEEEKYQRNNNIEGSGSRQKSGSYVWQISLPCFGAKLTENPVTSHFSCPQESLNVSQGRSERQSIILSDGEGWVLMIPQFISEKIVRLAMSKTNIGKSECSQVVSTKG